MDNRVCLPCRRGTHTLCVDLHATLPGADYPSCSCEKGNCQPLVGYDPAPRKAN